METPTKREKIHGYQQLKVFMDSHQEHLNEIKHFDAFFETYRMDVAFWSLSLKDNIYSYKQLFDAWKNLYIEIWMQEFFHDHSPILSNNKVENGIRMNKPLWRMIYYDYLKLRNSNEKYERERKLRERKRLKTYASHSKDILSHNPPESSIRSEHQVSEQIQQAIQQDYKKEKGMRISREEKEVEGPDQKNQVEEKKHQVLQQEQQDELSYIHMEPTLAARVFPPIMEDSSVSFNKCIGTIRFHTIIIMTIIFIILWFFFGYH